MSDDEPRRRRRPRWSPDSWVKIILVVGLMFSFTWVVTVLTVRAFVYPERVQSENVLEVLDNLGALVGVTLGYVLGRMNKPDD